MIENGIPSEWSTLLRLTGVLAGQGPNADADALEDFVVQTALQQELGDQHSPLFGADADALMAELGRRRGPERLLDLLLRAGPYDLTLDQLEAAPHGIDLGALEPRVPDVLRTPSGKIELAPAPIAADVPRLEASLATRAERRSCWSAAASCARTTRGCTTCRTWSAAPTAARCTSRRPTPSARPGRRRRRAGALARRRARRRRRGDRRR